MNSDADRAGRGKAGLGAAWRGAAWSFVLVEE